MSVYTSDCSPLFSCNIPLLCVCMCVIECVRTVLLVSVCVVPRFDPFTLAAERVFTASVLNQLLDVV